MMFKDPTFPHLLLAVGAGLVVVLVLVFGGALARLVRRSFCALLLLLILLAGGWVVTEWRRLPGGEALRAILSQNQIEWKAGSDRIPQPNCRGGIPINADDLPSYLLDALVAVEDRRFYWHRGVDPVGIARALIANLRAGTTVQGGSTLEMQLAKFMLLNPSQGYERKLAEAVLALKMNLLYSKREILALYLNSADFGRQGGWNATGIERAARSYFGKSASELTLLEAALLVGALNNPREYSPARRPLEARARAARVLLAMVRDRYISAEQMERALAEGVLPGRRTSTEVECRWFAGWALRELQGIVPNRPLADLRVVVTWSVVDQLYADLAVSRLLEAGRSRRIEQAALVSMTPQGGVVAMIGGGNFTQNQFDRATQARRQPGSVFKLFVYLAALESGYTMAKEILDAPISIDGWSPRNADGESHGLVTLRQALVQSYNQAAIRLSREVGTAAIIDVARRLGIKSALRASPSVALGASEVTLLELTAAYAPLTNGGRSANPYAIVAVLDSQGNVLYRRDLRERGNRVIGENHRADLDAALRDVLQEGTARGHAFNSQAAAKTGTSQGYRDAWIIGYTSRLVTGIWVGNDEGAPMTGVSGGNLPAAAWENYMANAHTVLPAEVLLANARP